MILEEIGFGAVGGVVAGALGAWVLRGLGARGWMEGDLEADQHHSHPLLAYGTAVALGGSGFIAAFVAGIVFAALAGGHAEETTFLAEQSGELLNAVTFLLFGAGAARPGARGVGLAARPVRAVQPDRGADGAGWPGANRYADWYAAHATDHAAMPESAPVTEQRIRAPALPQRAP